METIERTFSFAEFELDTATRRLLKRGELLSLNPKAFAAQIWKLRGGR